MKKRVLKIIISLSLSAILAGLIVLSASLDIMQLRFDNGLYDNVIRLHIPANSDSYEDQMQKMRVRDVVLPYVTQITSGTGNVEDAKCMIMENIDSLRCLVVEELQKSGYDYPVDVSFDREYYPVRYYESFIFPSGIYNSLKIVLGDGKGKNWWCVLYPSVCTSLASDVSADLKQAGITQDTADIICDCSKSTEISFYFLELYQNLKQHFYKFGGANA